MLTRPLTIAIVTGEASGDQLGASLVRALRARGADLTLLGVGAEALAGEGLTSLFPQADIAVMGLGPVIKRLPLILQRISETAAAVIAAKPDLVVTIDSPDFCKRVARRVRKAGPEIPIVHWVCPSVWAWRPGRAPAMRPYIDEILCLLPFEPRELATLNGPKGTYIGHPLIERLEALQPQNDAEHAARADLAHPTILLLPGSRMAEIRRLLPVFLDVADRMLATGIAAHWVLPAVPHLERQIRAMSEGHRANIEIVVGEAAKHAAFRRARAAIAASGTVTLELALAGVPSLAGYKVANWEAAIARRLIRVPSVVLPNLILGENVVPEFLQKDCEPEILLPALHAILADGPARRRQSDGFSRVAAIMKPDTLTPSEHAAELVLDLLAKATKRT